MIFFSKVIVINTKLINEALLSTYYVLGPVIDSGYMRERYITDVKAQSLFSKSMFP